MCGICGFFDTQGELTASPAAAALAAMKASLTRRGPDDEGDFADPAGHLLFGFRRHAILDLSAAGHQPMFSASRRSVIVMNGEIYNFPELRRELEAAGHTFRSRSDTEVLIEHLERSGLAILPRLRGMFAFAWYEIAEKRLTLVRDPFGIKPLHLQKLPNGGLAFASQLDTVLLGSRLLGSAPSATLDLQNLGLFLRLSHLPAPYGFYDGTLQLPPGSFLRCDVDGRVERGVYYEFAQAEAPRRTSREALLDQLEPVLAAAIKRHRLADVPLGVFLSGGIDSPLVAAMTREQSSADLASFTLASPGWDQDEGPAARAYAAALGLRPRVLDLDEAALLETFDDLIAAMSEPLADFSLLPTLLISRLARQEVKVVLSGDGGDELFFGYERPLSLIRDGAAFAFPRVIRRALYLGGRLGLLPRRSDTITFPTPGHYYLAVNQRFPETTLRRLAPDLPGLPADFQLYNCPEQGDWRDLLRFARRAELGGQLQRGLKKVDMASMYHGLEARVPLLDMELAALAASFDPLAHLEGPERELETKTLLRGLLARKVPPALLPRRKLGFSLPLAALLRGPLRQRVEATLLGQDLEPAGLFDRKQVEALWRSHLDGKIDAKWELWTLLSLQFFLRRNVPDGPQP